MVIKSTLIPCLAAATLLSACQQTMPIIQPSGLSIPQHAGDSMLTANTYAGNSLAAIPADSGLSPKPVTIVTTFVDGEDFSKSSPFGRTASEQVASRLAQLGIVVKEIKLRNNILMRSDAGELLLTREIRDIARQQSAEAAVVGSYTEGAEFVHVTTKLIRLSDSQVITAYSYHLKRTLDVASLLHGITPQDAFVPPKPKKTSEASSKSLGDSLGQGGDKKSLFDAIREYDREHGGVIK